MISSERILSIASARLSQRLFLITAVALAPAVLILFYNLSTIRPAKEREIHVQAFQAGQLLSLEVERIISGAENVLSAVAAAPMIQHFEQKPCIEYLSEVTNRLPQFAGIAVIDAHGIVQCRKAAQGVGVSLADRDYFKWAMTGQLAVGEYTKGRMSGIAILPIALPITDTTGKTVGVIAGSLDLKWLGERLKERSFAHNNALTIADRNGIILARQPQPEKFVGTRIPAAYQYLIQASDPGTVELTSQDGTRRILGYFPATLGPARGIYVSAGISTADAYAAITLATRFGIVVMVVGLSVAFLIAGLTSRTLIQRPVGRLVATVQAWRANHENERTGMNAAEGEFGVVGKAIDDFLDALTSSRQERDLLMRELDHRVKNLLATVRAVAQQTFRNTENPKEAVEVFGRRLAAMAEAHSLLMKDEWQSARMREVVLTSVKPFDDVQRQLFQISGPDFVVQSKAALAFSMALHELCTNAAKYGALSVEGGRVMIQWQVTQRGSDAAGQLLFRWEEMGGPVVSAPQRAGFGSKMIERMLAQETSAAVSVEYLKTGLVCRLAAPMQSLTSVEAGLPSTEEKILQVTNFPQNIAGVGNV